MPDVAGEVGEILSVTIAKVDPVRRRILLSPHPAQPQKSRSVSPVEERPTQHTRGKLPDLRDTVKQGTVRSHRVRTSGSRLLHEVGREGPVTDPITSL